MTWADWVAVATLAAWGVSIVQAHKSGRPSDALGSPDALRVVLDPEGRS
jgi:hypothetical protein